MELNTEKKVLLCQKALYSKQLIHYRELCAIYRDLANIAVKRFRIQDTPEASIADQVQAYYGAYLTKASKGDLSFLDHNSTVENGFLTSKFDRDQVTLFKNYAKASERVVTFQEASKRLHSATYHYNAFDINPELLEDYHDFMQGDNETRSFDNFITENSPRWIGHISYRRSLSELSKIREIDANHVANLSKRSITPKSFGAIINGARGSIHSEKERMKQDLDIGYSDEEIDEFSFPISPSDKLKKEVYKKGYHAKEFAKECYTAHKDTLKKALKRAAIIGLSLGMVTLGAKGVDAILDAHEFNHEVYMGNPAYEASVNSETERMMLEVDEFLTSLENSHTIPTAEQLQQATELVDNEGNVIVDNLIRNSFSQQFPNLTIPEGGVVIHYNKNHDSKADGTLGNYIYVTCQDSNGKKTTYTMTDFRSQGENRLKRLFEDERNVDTLYKDIDDSFSDNFTMNAESVQEYLKSLRAIHNNNIELAGSMIVVEDAHQIHYDNEKAGGTESLGDMINLKVSQLLNIDGKLRTVAPERAKSYLEVTTTTTPVDKNIDDGDER